MICYYQKQISPHVVDFGFNSLEQVRINNLSQVWYYRNLARYDDFWHRGTFAVVDGVVHPHPGLFDLPEAVLIALNRLYDEVDYETEND